jgi:uncharacterized membrane protein YccC
MARTEQVADAVLRAAESAMDAAGELAESARSYLATPEGRELRHRVATAVIVGLPLVSELPVFRQTALGRAMRTAALGALVIRGAEWLRDWEPETAEA